MDKEKIAKNLVNLRGNRTREEVCKAIGISLSALGMYERGERIPRDEIKLKISNFYGERVDEIFFK